MDITQMNVGSEGIIDYILGNSAFTKRLLSLGCIEGTTIKIKKIAPLGDPIIINFRGFDIAIRKKEAESIKIK
ncbi:FeoA family protein [Paraclostridium sordellii]|uniref:FeoA family protein n=1 Tax=Paraclostridium sordellii TaxID=1505 RepID=UPI0005DB286E|nr:ferrous iron transport protein A [Paeniclostridium sordellii]CEN27088.1 feoA protein [[Clostridium] sordellii] [Paeniclostridium sordellii]CEP40844.1 feoA protein [[Clostridium] sordellii] [Paeniclostridium sordellii]